MKCVRASFNITLVLTTPFHKQFVPSKGSERFGTVNPYDGSIVAADIHAANAEDLDMAVAASETAFKKGPRSLADWRLHVQEYPSPFSCTAKFPMPQVFSQGYYMAKASHGSKPGAFINRPAFQIHLIALGDASSVMSLRGLCSSPMKSASYPDLDLPTCRSLRTEG
jgi:hypothetical protein